MRRFISFVLTALLSCAVVACSAEEGTWSTGGGGGQEVLSDNVIVSDLRTWAEQWLSGLTGPGAVPLLCPGRLTHADIQASGPEARGCLWQAANGQIVARVQNLSRAPLNLYFRTNWTTLDPGGIEDYPLVDPQYRQQIRYQPNLQAAVARATIDYVQAKAQPVAVVWNECIERLEVSCILSALERILPEQIKIRNVRIPVRRIVQVLDQVWTYAPVVKAYTSRSAPPGTLTFQPR